MFHIFPVLKKFFGVVCPMLGCRTWTVILILFTVFAFSTFHISRTSPQSSHTLIGLPSESSVMSVHGEPHLGQLIFARTPSVSFTHNLLCLSKASDAPHKLGRAWCRRP